MTTETGTIAKPKLVNQIIINAPQARVWEAITKPEFTSRYYYDCAVKTDLTPGSPFTYHMPNGAPIVEGEVVESDPPNRLVHTYHSLWPPMNEDAPTQVTWELESMPGGVTKVTVVHEEFAGRDPDLPGSAERRLGVDPQQHEDGAGDRRADAAGVLTCELKLFSGLYLFLLPYAAKRRSERRTTRTGSPPRHERARGGLPVQPGR